MARKEKQKRTSKEKGQEQNKENKEKNNTLMNSRKLRKFEKQAWIVLLVAIGIIVILGIVFYFVYGQKEFSWHGIKFVKAPFGNSSIYLYWTNFSTTVYKNGSEMSTEGTVYFRKNPRFIFGVDVEINDSIKFVKNKTVYVSIEEPLRECEDNLFAVFGFGTFLTVYGLDIKGATANESLVRKNIPFVNCSTHENNTVIIIKSSKETAIKQTAENCYEISFKKCEILKALEKFELLLLEQRVKNT